MDIDGKRDELIVSFLKDNDLKGTAQYVRDGRKHRDLPDADLQEQWVEAANAFFKAPKNPGLGNAYRASEFEAGIRRLPLPRERALEALFVLLKAVQADPNTLSTSREDAMGQLADFAAETRKAKRKAH